MDFRSRNQQTAPNAGGAIANQPAGASFSGSQHYASSNSSKGGSSFNRFLKLGFVILLLSVAALVIALTFFLAFNKGGNNGFGTIQSKQYQAVFLNNGQVYFGKIKSVSNTTVDLTKIFYLQTNSDGNSTSSSSSNVSLVKLGCELHAPDDEMLINRDQVIFWENITDGSQVVSAINKYNTTNNGKLNCSQQSQSSTDQAPATSSSTTNTTTSTTPTKKP